MRTASDLINLDRPLVIAHRGYSQLAPENTFAAFRLALKAGVDLVELDYHQSKDRELMVIHDAELDRTTNARKLWGRKRIKVGTKTAGEIHCLDAGSWFNAEYTQARVPFLREALTMIQKRSIALVEHKSGDPAACHKIFMSQERHMERAVVQSFDWSFLRQLHELESKLTLAALGPPAVLPNGKRARKVFRRLSTGWLRVAQKTGAKVVVWNKQISAQAVRLAHHRDLKVWVYTVNNPKLSRRLLNCGVDGLITNDPALVRKSIDEFFKNRAEASDEPELRV
jgi:glycerophosphoryl diester phosphodiesterase